MHRFYIEEHLREGSFLVMKEEVAHQIGNVLRMQPGDDIVLFCGPKHDGHGYDFRFRIKRLKERVVDGEILDRAKNEREPRLVCTLFQSVLKKDKMEWIFGKGTEIGVSRFVPVVSERSIKNTVNPERAQKILKEAAEQSGRALLPEISDVVSFEQAIAQAKKDGGLSVFAHEKEIRSQFGNLPLPNQKINLFIGPEGGFSDKELDQAKTAGFFITSLSRRILRAETAAITGTYFLLHRFGN